MSTLATPPLSQSYFPRLLTAADLAVLPSELPSGPVRYELDNGKLVIMPPPGDIHAAVQSNIGTQVKVQGEHRGLGKARTEVAVILWRNPDRVVGADVAFIANSSLPLRRSKEGYLETIPDLGVEVRSKNDTQPEIDARVADYHTAGVRVVWVADPDTQTVTEYRRGQEPRVYTTADTLTIEDVIPGFRMSVPQVFQL